MYSWLKILEANKEGKFDKVWKHGPSVRFLIGACQTPIGSKFETEESAKDATKKMFEEIFNFRDNNGFIAFMSICTDIEMNNAIVVQLTYEGRWSKSKNTKTFDEVWERHGEEIINGEYEINPEEKRIVEEALGLN